MGFTIVTLHFRKKSNNKFRFCIDYRKLNVITRLNLYLLLQIDELLTKVQKTKFFIKLDIQIVFNRFRIYSDLINYTIFYIKYKIYKNNTGL